MKVLVFVGGVATGFVLGLLYVQWLLSMGGRDG